MKESACLRAQFSRCPNLKKWVFGWRNFFELLHYSTSNTNSIINLDKNGGFKKGIEYFKFLLP